MIDNDDPLPYNGPRVLASAILDLVPRRCRYCLDHFEKRPWIAEAFVSISGEQSSAAIAQEFYRDYHRNGHQELP